MRHVRHSLPFLLLLLALPVAAETADELALRLAPLLASTQQRKTLDAELTTEVRRRLLDALQSKDDKVRGAAAKLLVHAREPSAARAVITYYAYRLPMPKRRILPGVQGFGIAAAEPLAALVLNHPSGRMQRAAWKVFGQLHGRDGKQLELPITDPSYQKALLMIMFKAHQDSIRLGAISLARVVLPEDIRKDAFVLLAKDSSPIIAPVVSIEKETDSIAESREVDMPMATPEEIVAGAQSPCWLRRRQAVYFARTTWSEAIRDALFVLLQDPDTRVRDAAAAVLYLNMGTDEGIVTKLKDMLLAEDPAKQIAAASVLASSVPRNTRIQQRYPGLAEAAKSFWPMARRLAFSPDQDVRLAILRVILLSRALEETRVLKHMRHDTSRAIARQISDR
jgi:hypothetical protein